MPDQLFLQSFQAGANLYERAQARKMEQAQMQQQAAQFVLQKEQAALQQQLGALNIAQKGFELRSAQEEATAQTEDAVPFNEFQNKVLNWTMDPSLDENAIGTIPTFRSKAARAGAMDLLKTAVIARQNRVAGLANTVAARSATAAITQATRDLTTIASNFQGMEQFVYENGDVANPDGTPNWTKINTVKAKLAELMPGMKVARDLPQGVSRAQATAVAARGEEVTPDMLKRGEGQALTDATKKAKTAFTYLKEGLGLPLDDKDAAELEVAFQNGAQKISQKIVDEINFGNQLVRTMESSHQMIVDFDKKYGQGAFDEYVGPIDNPAFNIKARVAKLPEAAQEAKNIQDQVKQHLQSYRKANFGTALSASEQAVFKEFSPDPSKPVFAASLLNFANGARKATEIMVSKNWKSPQITQFQEEYFKPEFKNGVTRKPAATSPTSAQPAPASQAPLKVGRFTIEIE